MSESEQRTAPKELLRLVKKRLTNQKSINTIGDYVSKFLPSVSSVRQLHFRLSKMIEYMSELTTVQNTICDLDLGYDDDSDRIQFEEFTFT